MLKNNIKHILRQKQTGFFCKHKKAALSMFKLFHVFLMYPAPRPNMSRSRMPRRISSAFKNYSRISHPFSLFPFLRLSIVTIKVLSVYPKTLPFTVALNISTCISILFGKQFLKLISLSSIVLQMIWLQIHSPNLLPVSNSRSSTAFLVFFEAASFSRGSVVVYFILFYLFTFSYLPERLHRASPYDCLFIFTYHELFFTWHGLMI